MSADSSILLSTTGSALAFVSVLTTTNSCTCVPLFVTAKVTGPAAAVTGAGMTFHSLSSTATVPAVADCAGEADCAGAADGEAAPDAQPAARTPPAISAIISRHVAVPDDEA